MESRRSLVDKVKELRKGGVNAKFYKKIDLRQSYEKISAGIAEVENEIRQPTLGFNKPVLALIERPVNDIHQNRVEFMNKLKSDR